MLDFDLHSGRVLLRIVCGLFFLPQAIGKLTNRIITIGAFERMGLPYPELCLPVFLAFEFVVSAALILGIYTTVAAWLAAAFLAVAALSVAKVNKKWLWHVGGCEYPLFWSLCCVIVAVQT